MRRPSDEVSFWRPSDLLRRELWLAPAYSLLYLAYLFWSLESELAHWGTLVLLPFLLVALLNPRRERPVSSALASMGLEKGNLRGGLGATLLLGVTLGLLLLKMSRSGPAAMEAFRNGSALYLFPLAFGFLLVTAAFTEEFFFRGFLQNRLEALAGSRWWGVLLGSVLFGLYHLPYAYLNPRWPSAGDWGAAWASSLGQGIPAGLILGGLFLYSRRNLLAPVFLHALVDTFPAMGMIQSGGG